ncbi:hypothetical protein Y1Q_0004675 [Alligator mississippiensis]|uniref:Uncharacterized protein n=1 Tax=Alligator mississippiensis TaxID=8496 RepID=A0A151NLX1_ALLMI|nr:hypothetical protein Y1Q_0004675 [Alligator mississippiensis]
MLLCLSLCRGFGSEDWKPHFKDREFGGNAEKTVHGVEQVKRDILDNRKLLCPTLRNLTLDEITSVWDRVSQFVLRNLSMNKCQYTWTGNILICLNKDRSWWQQIYCDTETRVSPV